MEAAIGWAEASGARGVRALVSDEDAEKRALFEALGFTGTSAGGPSTWMAAARLRGPDQQPVTPSQWELYC